MNFKSYFKDKIPKMADQRLKLRDLIVSVHPFSSRPMLGGVCVLLGGSVNKTPPAEDTRVHKPSNLAQTRCTGPGAGLREGLPGTRKEGIRKSE